jgi:hypothetical protein
MTLLRPLASAAPRLRTATLAVLLVLFAVLPARAQSPGEVLSFQKISNGTGGLPTGTLSARGNFGFSAANLGDLDGDGVPDVLVGARQADSSVHDKNQTGIQNPVSGRSERGRSGTLRPSRDGQDQGGTRSWPLIGGVSALSDEKGRAGA